MKSSASGARRWGSACVTCRRRKIKCDGLSTLCPPSLIDADCYLGNKPSCSLCVRLGEQCIYRDVAGVAELQRQLQRAVQRIRELEDQLASTDRPQRRFSVHGSLPEDGSDALALVPSNEGESPVEDNDADSPEGARAKMSVDDHGTVRGPIGCNSSSLRSLFSFSTMEPHLDFTWHLIKGTTLFKQRNC